MKKLLFIALVFLFSCDTYSHWNKVYLTTVDGPHGFEVYKFESSSQVDSLFFVNFGADISTDSLTENYPPYFQFDAANTSFYCEKKWAHKNRTFRIWEDE